MIAPHFSIAGFVAVGVGAVLGAWLRWALAHGALHLFGSLAAAAIGYRLAS